MSYDDFIKKSFIALCAGTALAGILLLSAIGGTLLKMSNKTLVNTPESEWLVGSNINCVTVTFLSSVEHAKIYTALIWSNGDDEMLLLKDKVGIATIMKPLTPFDFKTTDIDYYSIKKGGCNH